MSDDTRPPHAVTARWFAANCIASGAKLVDVYGDGVIWRVEWDRDLTDEEKQRLEEFIQRHGEGDE